MKKPYFSGLFVIVLALILSLVFIGCDNGTGGGGGDISGGGDTSSGGETSNEGDTSNGGETSNGGGTSGGGGTSAFIGTWNGTLHKRPMTADFTASEWEIGDYIESASGTYTVSGATATLMKVQGGGQNLQIATAVLSNGTLTVSFIYGTFKDETGTFTK
jgi:hypothetical protein